MSGGQRAASAQGKIAIPIVVSEGDVTYRLREAMFSLAQDDREIRVDGDFDESTMNTTVTPGPFEVSLQPGWILESHTADADFLPVAGAALGSPNPMHGYVLPGKTTALGFYFVANGALIAFGDAPPQEVQALASDCQP
jgi:hypothetical protein